jgi:hypothetical protein
MASSTLPAGAFSSAFSKIEWAKEHIRNLHAFLQGFQREGDHRFFLQANSETGNTDLILKVEPLSVQFLLMLGDAVHNLSSALDHAWMVLTRASRDSAAKLTFPTNEFWENLITTVANSPVKGTFPEVERLIRDEIAPAKDRKGHRLWAIRQLDNLDKHNLIIPAMQVAAVENFIARSDQGQIFAGGRIQLSGYGALHTVTSLQGKAELYGNTKPSIDIVFREDQFLANQPVLPALRQTAQAVAETVKLFDETFCA